MLAWLAKWKFLDPALPVWKRAIGYAALGTLGLFALFLAYCFVAIALFGI